MASPQLEDGYTRIANELLDAICLYDFTKRQLKIVLALARRTYGFQKKKDDITVTRLAEVAGLSRSNTSMALSELVELNVVSKQDGRYGYVLGINKNYRGWGASQNKTPTVLKQDTSQNKTPTVSKQDACRLKSRHTKETPQKKLPKETNSAHAEIAKRTLDALNTLAGRRFEYAKVNLEFIEARLKDGATEAQLLAVVQRKVGDWLGDKKMDQYLRPATLFNRTKYAQYVGELGTPPRVREDRNETSKHVDNSAVAQVRRANRLQHEQRYERAIEGEFERV